MAYIGTCALPLFCVEAELLFLAIFTAAERNKLFLATLFCKLSKDSYLLACHLVIKFALKDPTFKPPMYK